MKRLAGEMVVQDEAAVVIQSYARAMFAYWEVDILRQKWAHNHSPLIRLQARWRAAIMRRRFMWVVWCATLIATIYRGYVVREFGIWSSYKRLRQLRYVKVVIKVRLLFENSSRGRRLARKYRRNRAAATQISASSAVSRGERTQLGIASSFAKLGRRP